MAKFRKKPVVVEAIQFWSDDAQFAIDWLRANAGERDWEFRTHSRDLFLMTLEGTMEARSGDWLIKGIKGEVYPCKPDIFEQTYEQVDV